MSFQAYLDNIEVKTGKTPQELIDLAHAKGFSKDTKSGEIIDWFKNDFSLGRGHAMALITVIKKGAEISDKHVGTSGPHSDSSKILRLDGIRKK